MKTYVRHVQTSVFAATICGLMLLSGCASVVYKDAAASYVVASKDLTKQLNEVSSRLTQAEDLRRRQKIVTDKSCPLEQDRLFVRMDPSVRFTPLIQNFPSMAQNVAGCTQLIDCERGGASTRTPESVCARACYSAAEGNCIKILEQEYARADKNRSAADANGPEQQKLVNDSQQLVRLLQQVEYGRGESISSKLIAANLQVLAQYMDLLEKASTSNKANLTTDVNHLTDRIKSVTDGFGSLTGNQLSSADKATRDNIMKSLGVLGKFGGNLQVLARNAKDADQIKAFVKSNADTTDALITSIEQVISGDDYLGIALNDAATRKAREAIAVRYSAAGTPYERGVLLDEALKYKYITKADSQKKLQDVFGSLRKSHTALRNLVLSPTDEQMQAIHSEEFQNFRTIVQDVAGVIAQFGLL
jgi:hypothetical protein